jgi:hypothetical protein
MKLLVNQKGIALVTALMLTLISMTIIMALFYLLEQGVRTSGAQKRYRTALEASYGGAEVVLKDVVPLIFQGYSSATIHDDFATADSRINMQFPSGTTCLQKKLNLPTSQWPSSCSSTVNAKSSADISFTLQAYGDTAVPFTVFTKIVDTLKGNSDTSGLQLEGAGVAEASSVITPQHFPFVYRLEVLAEASKRNPEQANLSVLYAY